MFLPICKVEEEEEEEEKLLRNCRSSDFYTYKYRII